MLPHVDGDLHGDRTRTSHGPGTAAVNQADSLHPDGGVGAGLGGLASGDGFPVVPVTALGGGALLAIAGVLALRRRNGAGQA
ncbi:hypothetical protein ACWHA3_18945 [Streptomyces cyaneofuscatus]|uniref:hypothetical protein n=1 Tax=Streptomyces sp. 021-4 TaxID=2789260 RepID=UPI0039F5B550